MSSLPLLSGRALNYLSRAGTGAVRALLSSRPEYRDCLHSNFHQHRACLSKWPGDLCRWGSTLLYQAAGRYVHAVWAPQFVTQSSSSAACEQMLWSSISAV